MASPALPSSSPLNRSGRHLRKVLLQGFCLHRWPLRLKMTGPGGTLSNGRVGGCSVTATHLRSQEAPSLNRHDQLHLALPLTVSAHISNQCRC